MSTAAPTPDVRWLLVAQLYAGAIACGVAVIATDNPALHLLVTTFMASAASLWVVLDARRRNRPIGHALQILTFLFWLVAAPIYLIVSRGAWGVLWSLLHVVGLYFVFALAYFLTGSVIYGFGG